MTYATASTAIIHELLGEEIIIANLEEGSYYSLRGSSVPIWQLLVSGHDQRSITSLFKERFHLDASEELLAFIRTLTEEGLLVELPHADLAFPLPLDLIWPTEFKTPMFEKYDEMKNLLMLDPVHEVDEQGWPKQL